MSDNSMQYAEKTDLDFVGTATGNITSNGKDLVQSLQQQQQVQQLPHYRTYDDMGTRRTPIRESRIKERPKYDDANQAAVKFKISLDLEVEVDLYARVKGDVTIGLM